MRLEQLQAFLWVAETGSFQEAAQKCNVTQSTVSRQVQALEAEVGAILFHRSNQAKLTLAGECLWPHARKICQAWENATQEIAEMFTPGVGGPPDGDWCVNLSVRNWHASRSGIRLKCP